LSPKKASVWWKKPLPNNLTDADVAFSLIRELRGSSLVFRISWCVAGKITNRKLKIVNPIAALFVMEVLR
jgi:hypothetical protein